MFQRAFSGASIKALTSNTQNHTEHIPKNLDMSELPPPAYTPRPPLRFTRITQPQYNAWMASLPSESTPTLPPPYAVHDPAFSTRRARAQEQAWLHPAMDIESAWIDSNAAPYQGLRLSPDSLPRQSRAERVSLVGIRRRPAKRAKRAKSWAGLICFGVVSVAVAIVVLLVWFERKR